MRDGQKKLIQTSVPLLMNMSDFFYYDFKSQLKTKNGNAQCLINKMEQFHIASQRRNGQGNVKMKLFLKST